MQRAAVLVVLALVIALPFAARALRPAAGSAAVGTAQDTVIVITPHNEAIRHEFEIGFARWYRERRGRSVDVDWRVIGGTSEITRFVTAAYTAAFEARWKSLGHDWSTAAEAGYQTDNVPAKASEDEAATRRAARAAFLESGVSCGIDVMFGGGSFDFSRHASAGRLVPSTLRSRQPGWFTDDVFPERLRGEQFRDPRDLWFGATISSYGIVYNLDSLRRIGLQEPPDQWADLGDPRLRGELALADPTKSGSINQAFEMVIQQQMQLREAALLAAGTDPAEAERRAIREGWTAGLRLIQRLGGNARYWTDTSQKPPIDVGAGNAAAGMAIDFYGRMQAEIANTRGGRERLGFAVPHGGTTFSVDPIALLRGAPNRQVAEDFIEFVLSTDGQRLWNTRVGAPGGPVRYNLRRAPVRKDMYTGPLAADRTDPAVQPYDPSIRFAYRRAWTGGVFREIAFIVRVFALDVSPELRTAWGAIAEAGFPPEAVARFEDVSAFDYDTLAKEITPTLAASGGDARLREVQLSKRLTNHFREQYLDAARLAREARRSR